MSAKYYVYYNLTKKVWSISYKGKVIKHLKNCWINHCTTKVRTAGRNRVLNEKRKNVHAFLVADECPREVISLRSIEPLDTHAIKVWYNPYKTDRFKANEENAELLESVYCFSGTEEDKKPSVVALKNLVE